MNTLTSSIPLMSVAAAVGICSCASISHEQRTRPEAALRAAQEVGAGSYPEAAYHLKLAKDQLAAAKPLVDGGRKDKQHAKMLLMRAEADAELALELAQTASAKQKAKTAWEEVAKIKSEN